MPKGCMKCVDMGYAIPVDEGYDSVRRAWYAVVERLNALRDERIYPQTLVLHLRFVGPGRGLLAPSGRSHRTCYIEVLTFHNTPRYEAYFEAVERDWLALGGRPHWGKLCFVPERIADLYGEDRKRFEEVRERLDPDGVFLNDWVRRILAI